MDQRRQPKAVRSVPSPSATSEFEKKAACFDASDARLSLCGHNGGAISVYLGGRWHSIPSAHLMGVHVVALFPSHKVMMSGGADTCAKVWSLEDEEDGPYEACVLQGSHQGAVLSVGFVGVGRNVLTGSRDGSIALWDIPSQTCSRLMGEVEPNSNVNALLMRNESEFVALRETGVAQLFDLRLEEPFVRSFRGDLKVEGAFGAGVLTGQSLSTLRVGTSLGFVLEYDVGSGERVLAERRDDARITAVTASGWVANSLGRVARGRGETAAELLAGLEYGEAVVGLVDGPTTLQCCSVDKVFLYDHE